MDIAIFHFINYQLSNGFFDWIMPYISNKWVWTPLYLLFIIVAIKKYKVQSWKPILGIVLCYVATEMSSNMVKHTLKRTRPNNIESIHAVKRVEGGSGFSMPSSHAANHMALAIVVGALLGLSKGWRLLLYFWAIVIGFSRIYNGLHFPSDVLVGWGLGALIALVFIILAKQNKSLKRPVVSSEIDR